MKLSVVAFGGNAISNPSKKEMITSQIKKVESSVSQLRHIIRRYRLVITHGNGSEIGNLLIQQEKSKRIVPEMRLDTLGAMTQGQLGYWIQQAVENILKKNAVTILTRVLVDKRDSAFKKPTKPIGPYYRKRVFPNMAKGLEGWRRVVPSPKPLKILDLEEIETLVKMNFVVISCGGGGIPVIRKGNVLHGIDAVIDKDFASQLLARQLKAELLIFITAVDNVYLDYGKKNQESINKMDVDDAKRYLKEGHFGVGSMKPKIEAAIRFLENGGKKVIITSPRLLEEALRGKAGTVIE